MKQNAPKNYEIQVRQILEDRIRTEFPDSAFEVFPSRNYPGKSGVDHQTDVSAEVRLAGLRLLILAECKMWSATVKKQHVLAFLATIHDIGANKGIIVTTVGFQDGAKKVAAANGISLVRTASGNHDSWQIIVPMVTGAALIPAESAQAAACQGTNVPQSSRENLASAKTLKTLTRYGISVLVLSVAFLWFVRSTELGKQVVRRFQDSQLYNRMVPGSASAQAKLRRHVKWIADDFNENPLSILKSLDHASFVWTNPTTTRLTRLNVVIPFTNQFELLAHLPTTPEQEAKHEWSLSEESYDEPFKTMLIHSRELRRLAQLEAQQAAYELSLFLPFSSIFSGGTERLLAVAEENPISPSPDEFYAFLNQTTNVLSRIQSIYVLGVSKVDSSWLLFCELRASTSDTPVLVLFHPVWNHENSLVLSVDQRVRKTASSVWQSEFEVVMPPSAWDMQGTWTKHVFGNGATTP